MAHCCLCNRPVERWRPHPGAAARSLFMQRMQTVGSDLSVFWCPHCGCNDRDRHLWLFMNALGLPEQLPGWRVLHLAPEQALEPRIAACSPVSYVRGDLYPQRADLLRIDAQALQFGDASFDLLIANHLLEHVHDLPRVLSEFRRVLRPGGLLLAQTPYSACLKHSFELHEPPEPEFARMFFGQEDHVRLFGADIATHFQAAGFEGELLPHEVVLPGVAAAEAGVNAREPFFVFTRPAA